MITADLMGRKALITGASSGIGLATVELFARSGAAVALIFLLFSAPDLSITQIMVETLSVIIQVASFKLTGKRVFRMAPLHHHFELSGWAEPKIIVRFWILSILFALIGLSTLKLR